MVYAIEASDLEKKYGEDTAVNRISFEVEKGEIFGLLGPNGAGKTTTTGMLSTLVDLTSGSAEVNGFDVETEQNRVRDSIGVVFQETALDDWLTGRENMEFHARMYDIPKEQREEKMDKLLELVDLKEHSDKQVENYSGGMKRRLEIARGLMQEPEILFLDEPTLGLDAETRRDIWDYIEDLNKRENMTIILTTHYMEEADFLCDRTAIMQDGKIIELDTPEALKDQLGGDIITVELEDNVENVIKALEGLEWVKNIQNKDFELSITAENSEKHIAELVETVDSEDSTVNSINLRKPSLEDVFLHLTGDRMKSEEGLDAEDG
jgi:ABC-2 type transport system ATP-binding protein